MGKAQTMRPADQMSSSVHDSVHDSDPDTDVIIVGGGLAGGLLAWRLLHRDPSLHLTLLERDTCLGGEHTWCFHEADVEPTAWDWLAELVSVSWAHHDLRFPNKSQRRQTAYHAIRSNDFHGKLRARLGSNIRFHSPVYQLRADHVILSSGHRLAAPCVIDARGFAPNNSRQQRTGWQKFVGLELTLSAPHDLDGPVLMDADCEQIDGFRFIYSLPWSATQILIEDTVYSTSPHFDLLEMEARLLSYASARGWHIAQITRREQGCLPIPIEVHSESVSEVPAIGARAGFFHMTTGYSLPDAVRLADVIASVPKVKLTSANVLSCTQRYQRERKSRQNFYRLLNRLLFQEIPEHERYRVFRHFYDHPADLVDRFYAGQTTWWDVLRIFRNPPPVPRKAVALRCLLEHGLGTS